MAISLGHWTWQAALRIWFLSAQGPEVGQQTSQDSTRFPFNCLALSESASGGIRRIGPLYLPWVGGAIQTSGEILGVFHNPKQHIWICSQLFPWTWLGRASRRKASEVSRVQGLGLLETRRAFRLIFFYYSLAKEMVMEESFFNLKKFCLNRLYHHE